MSIRRYNILFVTTTLGTGGLETYLVNVIKTLDFKKFCPIVVYNGLGNDDYVPVLKQMNIQIIKIPNSYWQIDFIYRVFKVIKDYKVDIVCDFRDDFSAPSLTAAKLAGVRSRVAMYRSSRWGFKPTFFKKCYVFVAHMIVRIFATRIIGNTSKVLDSFYKNWSNKSKFAVVHNGIPLNKFNCKEDRLKIRKELNIPEKAFVIGHVGRLHESKNHTNIIATFLKIKKECPAAHLLLVGEGELRDDIEKELKSNSVSRFTTMTGCRSDISRLHNTMDVFFYPSIFEGMPTAFIEAMASGLPFIASNIAEIEEIVPEELHDKLFHPNDVKSMSEAVIEFYEKPQERRRCGKIAYQWARNNYSIEDSVLKLLQHLLFPFQADEDSNNTRTALYTI